MPFEGSGTRRKVGFAWHWFGRMFDVAGLRFGGIHCCYGLRRAAQGWRSGVRWDRLGKGPEAGISESS